MNDGQEQKGDKGFFAKWKEGMMNLTPAQQLHAQLVGTRGSIFGLLFATGFMVYLGLWYFLIFLGFTIFLQCVSYIGIKQKYDNMIEVQNEINEMTVAETQRSEIKEYMEE